MVFMVWNLVFFVLLFPLFYFFSRKPAYYSILNRLRAAHAFLCTALSGIFFKFNFEEKLDRQQTYIYCANHSSNLDIFLFCLLAQGRFHFMGKQELTKNPILGIFFRTIDIPVQRESKVSAFRAFQRAAANLEQGMSLVIFPEGMISDAYPPVLHPFKSGPFRLAIEKKIPIVPVSIRVWRILWDDGKMYGSRPGLAHIDVHRPLCAHLTVEMDEQTLKEKTFQTINEKLV